MDNNWKLSKIIGVPKELLKNRKFATNNICLIGNAVCDIFYQYSQLSCASAQDVDHLSTTNLHANTFQLLLQAYLVSFAQLYRRT